MRPHVSQVVIVVATLFQIGSYFSFDRGWDCDDPCGGRTALLDVAPSAYSTEPSLAVSNVNIKSVRQYGYQNLTKPLNNHPHAGALDEYGQPDYVHDETILHHLPPNFQVSDNEKTDICAPIGQGPEGWEDLARQFFGNHVQVASPLSREAESIKVFCAVYTHPGNNNQTAAIRETWGRRCDGFMAASTETNHETATVHIPHQGPHQGKYKGIWQRVRSIVAYFHDNFLQDYDFLYLTGDDTYVIMENLKEFLANFRKENNGSTYFYTGARTHPIWMKNQPDYDPTFFYMGGGAGYILSRNTIQAMVRHVLPKCHSGTVGSAEDVYMGKCLQSVLNLTGVDSRDDQERDRFIQYDPLRRAALPNPADRNLMKYVKKQNSWLQDNYNWTAKNGIEATSPSAISFHMVKPAVKMRRYEHLIYRMNDQSNEKTDCGKKL